MAEFSRLDTWLAASLRRKLLDRDLERTGGEMTGRVLEIGNGRTGRRGRFQPPTRGVERWVYLDADDRRMPHIRGNVGRLPLAAGSFDTVVCLEVLEYVPEPAVALREIHRALRPNGILVLSTPFVHRVDAANDYWRFTEPGLRRLLQATESPFDVLRCEPQGSALISAAGVLKYAISSQAGWPRLLTATLAVPFLVALINLDARVRRQPALSRFTTGYLVVARRSA